VEGDYFFLSSDSDGFSQVSAGDPILARPFFNVQTGRQDSLLIAYPGLVQGGLNIQLTSEEYQSAGIRLRRNLYLERCCCQCCRVDLLAGYRFARLSDALSIDETEISTATGGVIPLGTRIDLFDQFDVENQFHGGELGLNASAYRGRWSLEGIARVALGDNHQSASIQGGRTVTVPGVPPVAAAGGFLALGTNSGSHDRDVFVVIPEFNVNLGYQINCNWRALVGYTLIYWSDVIRSGDQIDTHINPSQLPPNALVGAPSPSFSFHGSDFWAQGLNVGLEYRR
jgi:hypothetical protein